MIAARRDFDVKLFAREHAKQALHVVANDVLNVSAG
jgi:hypothetical protein